jgi:site-specific DNA recombinase
MPRQTRSPIASGPTRTLIYTRVSSDEQAREGVSLDAQLAECRRYALAHGWDLGDEYQDVMTGHRDDRPQYQQMLSDLRQLHADGRRVVVVVAALERLGRRLKEQVERREEMKTLGVSVHSVRDGGQVSDLVANVLASVAQEGMRRLSERVSASHPHIAASGWRKVGWVAWGYQWRAATPDERRTGAPARVLEIDESEAPYVREAFQRAATGEPSAPSRFGSPVCLT